MPLVVQTVAVWLALQLVLIGVHRWLLALIGAARDPIGLMTIAAATDHLDQPQSIHWSFRSVDRAASMLAAAGATAGGSVCSLTPWWVMTVTLSYSARLSNISLVKRQMASPAPPLGASHRHRL